MPFALPNTHSLAVDPIQREQHLLAQASRPVADLWQCRQALVVPRSYQQFDGFAAACRQSAEAGWPVYVRPSGGGLVPLDRGVLNLSLAYPLQTRPGDAVERIYRHLCALLQAALQPLGVQAHWQAVPGSFCDGRFNLAVGQGASARKIAGTAQYWRLQPGRDGQPAHYRVLAHALLLVAPDLAVLHQRANGFEALLNSGRHYAADKTATIAQCPGVPSGRALMAQLQDRLRHLLAHGAPPLD